MKIVGIIPSRYNSSRFPGKALVALGDRPLLMQVCRAALSCHELCEVYVATDSARIKDVCTQFGVPVIMTESTHLTPTSRVREASQQVDADLYVMIGGDEPLISPGDIKKVVDAAVLQAERITAGGRSLYGPDSVALVVNAMTSVADEDELKDTSNFKLVYNRELECLYISRNPIPCHHSGTAPLYKKFVSIGAYSREALDFFAAAVPGVLEQTEECDLLRFLEHGKPIFLADIGSRTLSVDTPADLERAAHMLKFRGELI